MSNHIDPKMQEIIARSEKDQKHLEMFMTESIKSRIRDIAYLLSEYKRLQETLERIKRNEMLTYGEETGTYHIADSALSHLKGE